MVATIEKISFVKYGGIYYTDQINFVVGQGTLTCSKLVFTTDASLKDTRIDEVSARHMQPDPILIRGRI